MAYSYVALKRNGKRVDEHRLVAGCQDSGNGVIVHHIDENKRNNAPSNLEIQTRSEHAKCHGLGIAIRSLPVFRPDADGMAICKQCGERLPFQDFHLHGRQSPGSRRSTCKHCYNEKRRQRRSKRRD
jgi:hypothetical protein